MSENLMKVLEALNDIDSSMIENAEKISEFEADAVAAEDAD